MAASRAPDPSSAATSGDSLRQLAGQRIVFGFQGTHAPRSLLQRIHRREAAGAILFSRSISSRSQLRSLTRALQAARPAGDPPVLVMIDQEGGVVKRLSGAPHHSPAELGKKNDASLARREGRDTARNLRDAGVNVNLAPVLDVGRPGSVMRKLGRSYSGDATRVSRIGGAFAHGLADGHVAGTGKHFPGLGAARHDEDRSINRIGLSASTLRHTDEAPFRALARDGLPLIMLSTAVYPALDSRPALFSPRIAGGELRKRCGFAGVSITDDLETAAAMHFGSPERRARLAAHAGDDLLLFAQSYSAGERGATELARIVGRTAAERSVKRIRALRESFR